MQALWIFPGNSLKNKAWGEAVAKHYGSKFDLVTSHQYKHWTTGAPEIDFTEEVASVREAVSKLPNGTEITVFAKSAGSLLTFLTVHSGAISPKRAVLFGIPFGLSAEGVFKDSWAPVEDFAVPTTAFLNENDPTAAYMPTVEALAAHAPVIKLITTHESDHWYGDFSTYDTYLD